MYTGRKIVSVRAYLFFSLVSPQAACTMMRRHAVSTKLLFQINQKYARTLMILRKVIDRAQTVTKDAIRLMFTRVR